MARDYIGHGVRARAQSLITLEFGPESELERVQKLFNEVGQERLTPLDRSLMAGAKDGILVVTSEQEQDPVQRTLRVGQLTTLERLGLAEERQQGVGTRRQAMPAPHADVLAKNTHHSHHCVFRPNSDWSLLPWASLLGERILPSSALAPLGKHGREVVQNLFAILALHVRHVVALDHPGQAFIPTLARHALRRHNFEAVAGGAEVEGIVAIGMLGILLGPFLHRPDALALRQALRRRLEAERGDRGERKSPRRQSPATHPEPHHPTSTAIRCIGLAP